MNASGPLPSKPMAGAKGGKQPKKKGPKKPRPDNIASADDAVFDTINSAIQAGWNAINECQELIEKMAGVGSEDANMEDDGKDGKKRSTDKADASSEHQGSYFIRSVRSEGCANWEHASLMTLN